MQPFAPKFVVTRRGLKQVAKMERMRGASKTHIFLLGVAMGSFVWADVLLVAGRGLTTTTFATWPSVQRRGIPSRIDFKGIAVCLVVPQFLFFLKARGAAFGKNVH